MSNFQKFFINGEWVAPLEDHKMEVINPSTETPCAEISMASNADVEKAIKAAKTAFDSWSGLSQNERTDYLRKLAEIYEKRYEDLAQAVSMEMGAPIDMALAEQVGSGSKHIDNFIKTLDEHDFEQTLNGGAAHEKILHEPIGVCSLIIPWNWPLNQLTLKAIPAIGVGCTVILKPSEVAPLSSMIFAEIIEEAGFPAGVFNLINGDGINAGALLTQHSDVDMVSFTGSTRAGVQISKAAADTVKRVSLELGGKGANIIFADADEDAVKRGVKHCFHNSGQSCNAPTRMLVERSIYDKAVEIAACVAKNTQLGPNDQIGKHIGPVVNKTQYDKINKLIEMGIRSDARLIAGGNQNQNKQQKGYFIEPTVFADVNNEMSIAVEEIFGPVLVMIPFDSEEEAVKIANDTVYGLTNYIQTSDPKKAERVAKKLRSGMVRINGTGSSAGFPFGGYKQSGNGREGGVWGIEEFMEVKHITGLEV